MALIHKRKKQHIEIIRNNPVEPFPSSFDHYRLPYCALPEIDMNTIDTRMEFFGFEISQPLFISSMSGGEKYGSIINRNIAIAAQNQKIPFGLGSMRIIDRYPEAIKTFDVKQYCPDVPMFTNLGLVQLNYGFDYDKIQKLIDVVKADGIIFHINHLHEAIQPEGDVNFEKLIPKLEKVLKKLKVPVIVKETGHGIDVNTAKKLKEIGINWIDVSGTGGTSWAWVESYRSKERKFGELFKFEGIPTTECLETMHNLDLNLIAGGGIRNGLHVAKAIALGAVMATSAKPFLHAALKNEDAVISLLEKFRKELIIAMFTCGAGNLKAMQAITPDRIDPHTGLKII